MTTTEPYKAAAGQARQATTRSVESWRKGAKTIVEQADVVTKMPQIDLTEPVARYFDYVQKAVDLNRDLATKWAELLTSFTGTMREQAEKAGHLVSDQVENVADLATKQAQKAEQIAKEQAEAAAEVEEGTGPACQAGRAGCRQGGQGEGPRTLRGPDQGGAQRQARRARTAEDGHRRGTDRAPGQRGQPVVRGHSKGLSTRKSDAGSGGRGRLARPRPGSGHRRPVVNNLRADVAQTGVRLRATGRSVGGAGHQIHRRHGVDHDVEHHHRCGLVQGLIAVAALG